MALNTVTGSGTQSATGTPQSVGTSSNTTNAASAGKVQTGTATSLLNSTQGISLGGSSPTVVSLDSTTSTTTTSATTEPAPTTHHINSTALIFCGILVVVAIASFVFTSRSAKNTT